MYVKDNVFMNYHTELHIITINSSYVGKIQLCIMMYMYVLQVIMPPK